ncbi:MAG: sugar ABC transporter permease [Oscillospiraceae bacterium]|nr:sugar ABC transporter permease [Oscillospiraceae bacterium]
MKYIDYVQLNPLQRAGYKIKTFFSNLPKNLAKFFVMLGNFFKNLVLGIGHSFANYGKRFAKGDWATKLSYIVMGAGNASKGQFIKGLLFLLIEAAYIVYMITFGSVYISKFGTLGTEEGGFKMVNGRFQNVDGDNSMLILLYGVMTIVITIIFLVFYIANTKSAYMVQQLKAEGKHIPTFKEDLKAFGDEKFHITLLSFPCLMIGVFSILPLIFMILIAFTNYRPPNLAPNALFTWQGLKTFAEVFDSKGGASMGHTFLVLTEWTIVWAIFATFLNYIMGMIVALMINKKGIKLKSLWRTLFVVTVAVPQFVTLLVMNQMLQLNTGAINIILQNLGMQQIDFINDSALVARITVIVINLWVGIPYTILITTGILMNIPADLYESATIDGAGPVKSFMKITLPYMLFVTTPYLITTFIGNINNFNVIYLLTNGAPTSEDLYQAGFTDLLVTWLFKLTMSSQDYNYAAAIGILVFIVCATLSLITFNLTKSAKDEEAFS